MPRESVLKDDPIHIDTALQQRMARINAAKTAKPIRRLRSKKRIIIDILCGKCSLAKYYLHHDSNAIIICIDRRDREDALSEIPRHMLARIRYVQLDAITLTSLKLVLTLTTKHLAKNFAPSLIVLLDAKTLEMFHLEARAKGDLEGRLNRIFSIFVA